GSRPDSMPYGARGGAAVGVGDSLSNEVYRVKADGAGRIRAYAVNGPVSAIAVGTDAVWVTSERADAVYAIDPRTGSLRTTIPVGAEGCNGPSSIAVNAEGPWVGCSLSQRVLRINPERGPSETLPVDGTPIA